jgi:hypothetical protein
MVPVRVPPETWARLEDPDEWIGHTDSESEDDGVGPVERLLGAEQLPEDKGGLGDEGKEGLKNKGREGHGDEGPDAGG